MIRHLLEVLKIIDAGMNSDIPKIKSYADLLAHKLQKDGELTAATRIREAMNQSRGHQLHAAFLQKAQALPTDDESKLTLGDREFFEKDSVSVFFSSEIQHQIEEFVSFTQASSDLIKHNVGFSPSLILFGPPGCGKSELAKHIAAQLERPLITARIDGLVSSFLGSTAKNLRSLFEYASNNPCVLFLDEFDAIAKVRDDKHEMGELKRVVVSLLQNIDKLDSGVVLIAATNHPHLLDPAIWRRFSYKVEVALPDRNSREKMFRRLLGTYSKGTNLPLLAIASEGMTGAEIRLVCETAIRKAVVFHKGKLEAVSILSDLIDIVLERKKIPLNDRDAKIAAIRSINPKVFTYERLSEIFGTSLGTISKILNEG